VAFSPREIRIPSILSFSVETILPFSVPTVLSFESGVFTMKL